MAIAEIFEKGHNGLVPEKYPIIPTLCPYNQKHKVDHGVTYVNVGVFQYQWWS